MFSIKPFILCMALTFCFSSATIALDKKNNTFVSYFWGDTLCKWMMYQADYDGTTANGVAYRQYIEGFLAAINYVTPGKADFFEGTDSARRYKLVFRYCEDNPEKKVVDGIIKLMSDYNVPRP